MAQTGAEITLAVRNTDAGAQAAADITTTTGNRNIHVARLDLADRASIAAFVSSWEKPLHVLVSNAGILVPEQHTPEGWEMQFAVNHLGHFALAIGLHGALAADGAARIVVISSSGHQFSPVVFDDIHFVHRPYTPLLAYGQSKTATVLFAVGATAHWAPDGITANALQPGTTPSTNLLRHFEGLNAPPERRKTPQQGAATSVLLATSPLLEGVGGRYFEDCQEAPVITNGDGHTRGVTSYALDPTNADRLWEESLRLLATADRGNGSHR